MVINKSKSAEVRPKYGLPLSMTLYVTLFLLGLWGCIAVYNATLYQKVPFHFVGLQLLWLLAGMVALFVTSKIPFDFYKKYVIPIALVSYIPIIFVVLFGVKVNGMSGWFRFGSFMIQPTEFSKAPFVLLMAIVCSKFKPGIKHFAASSTVILLWIVPIMLQPDFGTMLVYLSCFLVVYFISCGDLKYLFGTVLAGVPLLVYIVAEKAYVLDRFKGFLNPMEDPYGVGWHVMQFRYTLANGGFFGRGLGKAMWSNSYLPLSHSDSAFASFAEAVGFVGTLPVVFGFFFLLITAFRISLKITDDSRRIFVWGVASIISVQAFIHISVNLTIFPTTGITLPLFSYGGSSLVSTFIAFGMLLSAARKEDPVS